MSVSPCIIIEYDLYDVILPVKKINKFPILYDKYYC